MLKETPKYGENRILSRAQSESGVQIFTSLRFTRVISTVTHVFGRCLCGQIRERMAPLVKLGVYAALIIRSTKRKGGLVSKAPCLWLGEKSFLLIL